LIFPYWFTLFKNSRILKFFIKKDNDYNNNIELNETILDSSNDENIDKTENGNIENENGNMENGNIEMENLENVNINNNEINKLESNENIENVSKFNNIRLF
jgi:hypothetical protein